MNDAIVEIIKSYSLYLLVGLGAVTLNFSRKGIKSKRGIIRFISHVFLGGSFAVIFGVLGESLRPNLRVFFALGGGLFAQQIYDEIVSARFKKRLTDIFYESLKHILENWKKSKDKEIDNE